MKNVMIDSGQFKLMRNVDITHQPSREKVYAEWIRAFNYNAKAAIEHLGDVIEDTFQYELWKDNYLPGPKEFFERIGIFGLDLDEPAKLIRELRKKKSKKKEKILERVQKAKALREEGKTQVEIAEELKVDQGTVSRDLCKNEVMTQKLHKEPRKRTVFQISQYTKPETAAQNIRKIFGDEFAEALRQALERP